MKITPELRKIILEGTNEERVYILKHSFEAFCIYYFTDYFIYDQAEFHHDFFDDCDRMAKGSLKETVWVGHKECSKTSFGKMFTIYLIVYGLRHFINYDSYDKGNSESALFDIVVELQTNQKLISDFGSLFNEERADNEKKLKKISSFITANDIKVEAFSTGQSTRGRIYKQYRPDVFVIDDVENSKTINSPLITQQVINHIDELRAGLAADALVLYLGNYQSDQGTVQYIMDTVERSGGVVRFIPAITAEGKPAWSAKYTLTDAEALAWEKENPDKKKKISLENKRKELGEVVFATEMLLNPVSIGDLVFDKPKIERLLATPSEPYTDNAGFRLFDKFNPRHRYAIGADTALGVGRDSNASCLIDFTSLPARQIGSFADATIPPDVFAHELKRQGIMFGTCLLAPEVNNCFDKETEILTNEGWKLFKDLNKTEEVATLNLLNNHLEFQKPLSYTKKVEEWMYLGKQGNSDFCVSGNHNMLVYNRRGKNPKLIPLEENKTTYMLLNHSALWEGKEVDSIKIGNEKVRMDDWLNFLGIFVADGNTVRRHGIEGKRQYYHTTIAQSESYPEKIKKIREYLDKLPFHYFESEQKQVVGGKKYNSLVVFHITNKELWEHLEQCKRSETKQAPQYVLNLSSRQIQLFLDSFFMGDGYARRGNEKHYYPGLSKILADQLQEMLLKTNKNSWINPRIFKNQNYEVAEYKPVKTWFRRKSIKKIKYNDFAYCLSVPNKTLVVRRGGRPIILGNTGYATVTELRGIYDVEKIYRPSGKGVQYEDAKTNQLGFQTNLATKPDIIFQLKSAVEDGLLVILDKRILRELLKYRRAELNQRGGKDPNATRHFDMLMACFVKGTMVLTDKGQRPIETLSLGDKVMTRKGYKPITAIQSSIKKVITNIGLTGTEDHPVFCNGNELKDLSGVRNCDILYIWDSKARKIERLSFTEAQRIIDTQIQNYGHTEYISQAEQGGKSQLSLSIDKFGWTISELFQKGLSCTTKTTTRLITPLKIFVYYLVRNTQDYIWQSQNGKNNLGNFLPRTEQKSIKVFGSIIKTKNPKKLFVLFADYLLQRLPIMRNFALANASIGTAEKNERNQELNEYARFAGRDSLPEYRTKKDVLRSVPITDQENGQRVYNLEVAECPEYFANTVLVHNCAIAWAMRIHAEANNNPAAERSIEENRAGRMIIKQDSGLA